MKLFLAPLIEHLRGQNAGVLGGLFFFALALLWVIFGFWKMIFILAMTCIGYGIGVVFFRDQDQFRKWVDRIFPPGFFR